MIKFLNKNFTKMQQERITNYKTNQPLVTRNHISDIPTYNVNTEVPNYLKDVDIVFKFFVHNLLPLQVRVPVPKAIWGLDRYDGNHMPVKKIFSCFGSQRCHLQLAQGPRYLRKHTRHLLYTSYSQQMLYRLYKLHIA